MIYIRHENSKFAFNLKVNLTFFKYKPSIVSKRRFGLHDEATTDPKALAENVTFPIIYTPSANVVLL